MLCSMCGQGNMCFCGLLIIVMRSSSISVSVDSSFVVEICVEIVFSLVKGNVIINSNVSSDIIGSKFVVISVSSFCIVVIRCDCVWVRMIVSVVIRLMVI